MRTALTRYRNKAKTKQQNSISYDYVHKNPKKYISKPIQQHIKTIVHHEQRGSISEMQE